MRFLPFLLLTTIVFIFPGYTASPLSCNNIWGRPAETGNTAVYLDITALEKDDLLLSAEVDPKIAARCELHTHIQDGNVMRMQRVEGSIACPKNTAVIFKPGGAHIMIMGIQSPLRAGDYLPLTLKFQQAGGQTLMVPIMHNLRVK